MGVLYLDLEGTIIKDWQEPVILWSKVDRIKRMIEIDETQGELGKLGIFSWAIWDDKDKQKFEDTLYKPISNAIGMQIDLDSIPSVDDLVTLFSTEGYTRHERQDIFDFYNKESAFIKYCRLHYKEGSFILMDDVVTTFLYRTQELRVGGIDVNNDLADFQELMEEDEN